MWLVKDDSVVFDCPTCQPENYIFNVNCFQTEHRALEVLWDNLQRKKSELAIKINLVEARLEELDHIEGHVTD